MTEKTKHNLQKGFAIFLSAWTALVGAAFIVQVWRIYGVGEKAFTPERIGAHFRQISVPVYIWLAAVLGNIVLALACPKKVKKVTPYIELKDTLARLNRRVGEGSEEAKKQQKMRLIAQIACAVVCTACAVVALVYMLADYEMAAENGFLSEHKEAERILRALVWTAFALGVAIATAYFIKGSYKKEIALAKTAIAENAKKGIKAAAKEETLCLKDILKKKLAFVQSKAFVLGVRIAIAVVAVAFVAIGVFGGGVESIFYKAINICTQCIGIG